MEGDGRVGPGRHSDANLPSPIAEWRTPGYAAEHRDGGLGQPQPLLVPVGAGVGGGIRETHVLWEGSDHDPLREA